MAQTAAHLVDHVIPPVSVRQWVISVPKRRRSSLATALLPQQLYQAVTSLTRIFLDLGSCRATADCSGEPSGPHRDGAPPRREMVLGFEACSTPLPPQTIGTSSTGPTVADVPQTIGLSTKRT